MSFGQSVWWRVSGAVLLVPLVLAGAGCSGGPGPGVTATGSMSPVPSGSSGQPGQPTGVASSGTGDALPPGAGDVGGLVTSAEDLLGVWQVVELDGVDMSGARDHWRYPLMVRFLRNADGELRWSATDGCSTHGGRFAVTADGTFRAEPGTVQLNGCVPPPGGEVALWPRNPAVVAEADQARIIVPQGGTAMVDRQLVLNRDGAVLGVYSPPTFGTRSD